MQIIFIVIGIVALYLGFLSHKLTTILSNLYIENKHLKMIDKNNQNSKNKSNNSELVIDHSLAKRVADEIIRLQLNLSRMDQSIKGFKQINASVRKLEQSLNSNHYELENLLNQPYDNGMNLQASFVENDSLEANEAIITRIIKPQINYKGKLIQAAQVEVSQGF